MIRRLTPFPAAIIWLSLGFALSVGTLMWLGYRSTTNWKESAALVSQQSTEVAVDLLSTALTRDMRAVQTNVLLSLARSSETFPRTLSLQVIVSAFTLYPYPEVFFVKSSPSDRMDFYGRSDRTPAWLEDRTSEQTFPVTVGHNSTISRQILDRVNEDVETSQQFAVFDLTRADHRGYQVVTFITYEDVFREKPKTLVGFMVDLDWIRRQYVPNVIAQVSRTANLRRDVAFTILDEHEERVAGVLLDPRSPMSRRSFPLLFIAPSVIAPRSVPTSAHLWTAVAIATESSALHAAEAGSRQALAVSIAAALTLTIALAVTLRAVRARTQLVEMRSDFISAVTHELKTPIAGIRALMDMLASDRVSTTETAKDYARLAAGEVRRLARLAENLLAYARVTNVTEIYSREPVDISLVVTECLQHFWPQLAEGHFEQHLEIPSDLPLVRVDQAAISLLLSNIVDNAIRYSEDVHDLTIRISRDDRKRMLLVDVADRGAGIEEKDITDLTTRYFRGQQSRPGGAGLGLAIANRIALDHGGWLTIRSRRGVGTTVTVALPMA
ncbi:MAG TPA: HAMP domain-containing sensor histidine kinase [Vicinamibacterales bacterium]|nr:HAMP domain-containing sensor histidine kinase [Vicinamibacterales bacterium]